MNLTDYQWTATNNGAAKAVLTLIGKRTRRIWLDPKESKPIDIADTRKAKSSNGQVELKFKGWSIEIGSID